MNRQRMDIYDDMPSGLRAYLQQYGWHFSKKLCEWAVSRMKRRNAATGKDEPVDYLDKDKAEEILKKYNVNIENDNAYDVTYVMNMARADYMKSSISDEAHLALFVKDYLDDTDGYDGIALTRFYADCIGKGIVILWEDMI